MICTGIGCLLIVFTDDGDEEIDTKLLVRKIEENRRDDNNKM
jgi:hypothetical protein